MAQMYGDDARRGEAPAGEWPRLQLPVFSLRTQQQTPSLAPRPAAQAAQRHEMALPPQPPRQPQMSAYGALGAVSQPAAAAPSAPPPGLRPAHLVYGDAMAQPTPQPTAQHPPAVSAAAPRPMFAASAPRPTYVGAGTITASIPATARQDGLFGGRISPMQLGVLMSVVALAFVITRGGPAPMDAGAPASLPAAPSLSNGAPSTAGSETLPFAGKPVGMPSPAAAQRILADRGARRAKQPPSAKLRGVPSAAAAGKLADAEAGGTATLPMRADDGMSLPADGSDRDAHAGEAHYGGSTTLPMEREVELPAVTPAEAAARAEVRSIDVTPDPYGGQPTGPNHAL